MEFEDLMLEHARIMANMAEALARFPEKAVGDRHVLVERFEGAEKHFTSTIHQIFENVANGISLPPKVEPEVAGWQLLQFLLRPWPSRW